MTKKELMNRFEELKQELQMDVEGINWNSNKDRIQNAIDCLESSDKKMDECLAIVSKRWANIGKEIQKLGDWKRHQYFRLYVYNHAKLATQLSN